MSVALAERIAKLEDEIATVRAAKAGSMRQTQCCPECGGRAILHFTKVTERANASLRNLSLAHAVTWKGHDNLAELEAFCCRGCGKVDWYASGMSDVEVDGELVRLLDGEPGASDAGPYR